MFLQGLAAFLKAIGYLIPLMDAEYANYYTREVMLILIREFQSPDEEMKKIVLKVKQLKDSCFSWNRVDWLTYFRNGPPTLHCELYYKPKCKITK